MKKNYLLSAFVSAMLAVTVTGCADSTSESNGDQLSLTADSSFKDLDPEITDGEDTEDEESENVSVTKLSNNETEEPLFTERDLEQEADISESEKITVSDNKTIDITEEGVYVISGTASDCTIKVDTDENAKIQLVLDGVNVTNASSPVIYVVSADKTFVTTTDTQNAFTVTGNFSSDGETNTDAVIYSKDDLVLNGTGTLTITSNYGNGVTSKDDLKITGGTYIVGTELDAFESNDSISVSDGNFTVRTNKDGFHCENDENEGTITVTGGTFSINGKSDGFDAAALLQIDGGNIDITAAEGFEATQIIINDGTVKIYASDDGINASSGNDAYETSITVNGGDIDVEVGAGDTDAFDANGSIYINGGSINVTSGMSSFDYDVKAEFNGGTIIINGTEVSEIPQSMMGGGRGGMMNGGAMNGGFGRNR